VRVAGKKLYVDGEIFHVKGISWNPIPRGGLHPQSLDYAGFADLDIPMMVNAGINVVRTYEPIEDRGVLDKLHAAGIYVINSVYPWGGATVDVATNRVSNLRDHPAILMWLVGNEWNYNNLYTGSQHDFAWSMARVQAVAAAIHTVDSNHPVISSYGHVPPTQVIDGVPDVDVWGANVYTGLSLNSVFSDYRGRTAKPLLITEYGADAWNANAGYDPDSQAEATRVLTQAIFEQCSALHDNGFVLGGALYSWADEWHKAGNPNEQDTGGSAPGGGPHPDMVFNEEYWGIVDIDRNPRPAYDALREVYTSQ
jgi:beta-galactosidase/beta-glucuronidase